MTGITVIEFWGDDVALLGSAVGGVFGSLAASSSAWETLGAALVEGDADAAGRAAEALLSDAIPTEGDPDPQRGWLGIVRAERVTFITPGNVAVTLEYHGGEVPWGVAVDFHRLSKRCAADLVCALARRGIVESID